MDRIVLLSCSKSKLDHKAPAQELYSASPTFTKTLAYGKSLKPDRIYILSAKHYLVPLDKELEPYDLTLKEMNAEQKEQWGDIVIGQMKKLGINPNNTQFIFLTGQEYMKPLLKFIPQENIQNPLVGKRMGERMQWLNTQLMKINEILTNIKRFIHEIISK